MTKGRITDLSNVHPGNLERRFDNEEWTDDLETRMKFMRVKWSSDYTDIVDWTSEQMRNDFFEETHPDEIILDDTGYNFRELMQWNDGQGKYQGAIRVNLPAEAINQHNYLSVLYKYPQPVPPSNLPRETRYYFFIKSINNIAPNTTEVFLQLDVWTTYKFLVNIKGLNLERGHYPLANTSATAFLANPLEVPIDLTADEEELPRVKPLTSSVSIASLQTGDPRVCIATTANLAAIGKAFFPNRNNVPADNWWTLETNGFLDEGTIPVEPVEDQTTAGQTPAIRVFSLAPGDFNNFVNTLRKKYPQVIKTIKAVYVLSTDFITEQGAFNVLGTSVKVVQPQTSLNKFFELQLNKSLWGYESQYADFAKLYTGQFSEIVINDFAGFSKTISVEDLAGNLEFYARANTVFPFLKLEAFINGIGGKTFSNISLKPWGTVNSRIYNSKWSEYRFEIDVPTYSIYVDAIEDAGPAYNKERWKDNDNRKKTLNMDKAVNLANHQSASETIAAEYQSAADSTTAEYTNRVEEIANTRTNEKNINDETKAMDLNVNYDTHALELYQDLRVRDFEDTNALDNRAMKEIDSFMGGKALDFNLYATAVDYNLDMAGATINALTTAATSGVITAGAAIAAGPAGVAVATIGVVTTALQFTSALSKMEVSRDVMNAKFQRLKTEWDLNYNMNPVHIVNDMTDVSGDKPTKITNRSFEYQGLSLMRKQVDLLESIVQRNSAYNYDTSTYIRNENLSIRNIPVNATHTLNEVVSINNQDTATGVNLRTRNTNAAINVRTRDTAIGVNNRTKTTADALADNTNAITQNNIAAKTAALYSGPHAQYGTDSGAAHRDQWAERGFTVTINRISKSAEKLVGEAFRVSGYTIDNLLVKNPTLSQMSNFTYWKASRIWTEAAALNDSNEIIIKNCFLNGCTIWRDPRKVKQIELPNTPQGVM